MSNYDDRVIKTKDLAKMLGMSSATLLRNRHEPGFPKPLPHQKKPLTWSLEKINDYLKP